MLLGGVAGLVGGASKEGALKIHPCRGVVAVCPCGRVARSLTTYVFPTRANLNYNLRVSCEFGCRSSTHSAILDNVNREVIRRYIFAEGA